MKKICVIGSLNVELTVSITRFHAPGETIAGRDFKTFTGGKGGNQAVAARKLGADVRMVGKLGLDNNGSLYRQTLEAIGIHHDSVADAPEGMPSGVALIEVDAAGENRIIVVPGANALVDKKQIDGLLPTLLEADIFLLQLEIPMETVEYIAKKLHDAKKTVILDPAPAVPLSAELISHCDYITPNETELALLTGKDTGDIEQAKAAARSLLEKGVKAVLAKRGKDGAMLITCDEAQIIPGFKVKAIDTTAAGDSFNAGFAVALSMGYASYEAVRFANAVGALSTTALGAQGAMPNFEQVQTLLNG